jgi:hypothetical protein
MGIELHTVGCGVDLILCEKLAVSRRVGKEEYSKDSEEDSDPSLCEENEWPGVR